jgi:hypothetical protein
MVRTLVEAGYEAFNNKPGTQLHVRQLSHNARLKILEPFLHAWTYRDLRVMFRRLSISAFAELTVGESG